MKLKKRIKKCSLRTLHLPLLGIWIWLKTEVKLVLLYSKIFEVLFEENVECLVEVAKEREKAIDLDC